MSISDFKKSQKKYKIRKYKKKYKESKLLEAFFILVFVFVWGYNTKIIPTYALCVISLCILTAILYRSLAQVNKKRKYLNLSQEQIDVLSGKNFEQYLQIHFKELGYRVKATPDTNDYGADLLLNIEIADEISNMIVLKEPVYKYYVYNEMERNASVGKYYEYEQLNIQIADA